MANLHLSSSGESSPDQSPSPPPLHQQHPALPPASPSAAAAKSPAPPSSFAPKLPKPPAAPVEAWKDEAAGGGGKAGGGGGRNPAFDSPKNAVEVGYCSLSLVQVCCASAFHDCLSQLSSCLQSLPHCRSTTVDPCHSYCFLFLIPLSVHSSSSFRISTLCFLSPFPLWQRRFPPRPRVTMMTVSRLNRSNPLSFPPLLRCYSAFPRDISNYSSSNSKLRW